MPHEFRKAALDDTGLDHDVGEHRSQPETPSQLAQTIIVGQLIGDRHEPSDAGKHSTAYCNGYARRECAGTAQGSYPHRRYEPFIDEL